MHMWKRFDIGEIGEDFAHLASLGIRLVRFFLLWEDFQPEPDRLDAAMRDRLIAVVDAAGRAGLSCMPTLFTGHMSGVNWLPEWTLDRAVPAKRFRTINALGERPYGIGDFYRGDLLEAQVRFAAAAGSWLRGHHAVYAWDLGNEFSNLRGASSAADAAAWSKRLSAELEGRSGIPVTAGLHGEDLTEDRGIRLSTICAPWPFATMHGYAAYSEFARSPGDVHVVPFLFEMTRTFAKRDVLFAEVGTPAHDAAGSVPGLEDDDAAAYCEAVLDALWQRGALGAAWWCYADYVSALATLPPFDLARHELSFGIVRADGSEKPVAKALARIAAQRRPVQNAPQSVDIDEEPYYAGLPQTVQRAYAAFVSAAPASRPSR
jgi:endo-1,4-beta-mannosidase